MEIAGIGKFLRSRLACIKQLLASSVTPESTRSYEFGVKCRAHVYDERKLFCFQKY